MGTQRVKRKTKSVGRKTHRKKDARSGRVKRSSKKIKKTRKIRSNKRKINRSKRKQIRAGAGAGSDGKYKNIIKGLTTDIIKLKQKLEECEDKSKGGTGDTPVGKLTTDKIDSKFMDRISASLQDYKSSPRGRRIEKENQNVREAATPPGTPPDSE